MSSISDKITDVTAGGSNPNVARVTATRSGGGTTLTCDNLSGWPVATTGAVHFSTYRIDTSNNVVANSQIDWKGLVTSSTTIGSLTRQAGASDAGNAIGDVVEMNPTGSYAHDLYTALKQEHNVLDGTHSAITATSLAATGAVSGATGSFSTSVTEAGQTLQTLRSETQFDFVASGCVWTADSAGTNRNASMTAGVVYIGGKRVTVALVTARTFTASKDTYIDVDNTGSITYTEVTNNAASPALSANNIRLGIIVTAAGSIATAGSVNQGQEDRVLPIASSVPYAVTDSLGNLICPRDPQRKIIGYRQITADQNTSSASVVDVTGLNLNCIVPNGRKVKVSAIAGGVFSSGSTGGGKVTIFDVTDSVERAEANGGSDSSGDAYGLNAVAVHTPSASTRNYKVQMSRAANAIAFHINSSSTNPGVLMVELA